MPRYFFNIVVRRRKAIPDPEGDELAGDREALEHAATVARDMTRETGRRSSDWNIGIRARLEQGRKRLLNRHGS
jgi:hypothetical protein